MNEDNMTQAAITPDSPKITPEEIVRAVSQELQDVRREIYALQAKVRKYEQIFERAFQEELQTRLGSKQNTLQECGAASPLTQMQWTLEKAAAQSNMGGRGL